MVAIASVSTEEAEVENQQACHMKKVGPPLAIWKHSALYRLGGSTGKKKFFFNWLAFTHFWSNFDEFFCAGVRP